MEETNCNPHIETIARGVCVVDGKLLLCYNRKSPLSYLPGGHIEWRETARQALEREIREEMGLDSKAGEFLGGCEQAFVQNGKELHTEITLYFRLEVPDLVDSVSEPPAVEPWIGFKWQPLDDLPAVRVVPEAVAGTLAEWLRHPGGFVTTGDAWLENP